MHPDLELIVSADEEARARVTLAEQRHQGELNAARVKRDAAVERARKEASDALERDLQAIRAEGDGRVAEMQRQQKQYLAALAAAGEQKFDGAVALYQRIVGEVSS